MCEIEVVMLFSIAGGDGFQGHRQLGVEMVVASQTQYGRDGIKDPTQAGRLYAIHTFLKLLQYDFRFVTRLIFHSPQKPIEFLQIEIAAVCLFQ